MQCVFDGDTIRIFLWITQMRLFHNFEVEFPAYKDKLQLPILIVHDLLF